MLTLFYKPSCPFCHRVLDEAQRLGVTLHLKDVGADGEALKELLEKGGKKMVPYLVDDTQGTAMYESSDIMLYLQQQYSKDVPDGDTISGS